MCLKFPSLYFNKTVYWLSKTHQTLPTLDRRAILQAAKILFVVL